MPILAMVRVTNLMDHTVSEDFPVYGRIELAEGETRRVPVDVAQNWSDPERNGRALVEVLDAYDSEDVTASEIPNPATATGRKGK